MSKNAIEPIHLSVEDILLIERRIRREEAKRNGAYDGRLNPKINVDRKKEKNRTRCRKKVRWHQ